MVDLLSDTIVAQATPSGRAGVGIVRVSGENTKIIAERIIGFLPKPRYATFSKFKDQGLLIDEGIAIYFPAPNSFTGEDVLELQAHGGPVVIDLLVDCVLKIGARVARPGEFSKRAFLNNKIDLTQAEAIADLINATSKQAARSALRSLQGEFSNRINQLVDSLIELRMYIESAIDFSEEEIDFLADDTIRIKLGNLLLEMKKIEKTAQQGALLRDGINLVIAGKPNVGKSSLLNLLSGQEIAIVTDIPGTTRDILRESIYIDGMPIHIFDTAGLRITDDIVEKEGVRRTKQSAEKADLILLMIDASLHSPDRDIEEIIAQLFFENEKRPPIIILENKIDLTGKLPDKKESDYTHIKISVKTGAGIDLLKDHLKKIVGFETVGENDFIARRRHCDALTKAKCFLERAHEQLLTQRMGEFIAEDLRQAQNALSEITGEFRSDDLLGKIFSEFCIGK